MTLSSEQGTADRDRYLGFLKLAAGILTMLLLLGYLPTVRMAGDKGLSAMFAGCGVSTVGSMAGTVPLLLSRGRSSVEAVPVLLGSIALRLTVVIALAAAVALLSTLAVKPFLVWVGLSHVGLLVADTLYALGEVRAREITAGAIKHGAGP